MQETLLALDPRLHVVALVGYALAAGVGIVTVVTRRESWRWTLAMSGFALAVHSAGLLTRWIGSGHGPYLTRYELLSAYAWASVVTWLIWSWRDGRLRPLGAVVMPVVMLLIGLGLYTGPEVRMLPPTFTGIWLTLHVSFYFVAFATGLVSFGASALIIARSLGTSLAWAPPADDLDGLAYRSAGLAFSFWGVGLLTGSIWAYYSWGRFWGWDPVETWSLITWLVFGVYLHLRRFYAWRGARAAVLMVACFSLALLSLFGTSLFTSTVHSEYFS
ncbi:MAG: cytochrome c biogenesis protein CcsA [Coriobacteriia bacterium]|nr:cytochrome c biogenesis protein CcsA [Coriobacteriia bacterium]